MSHRACHALMHSGDRETISPHGVVGYHTPSRSHTSVDPPDNTVQVTSDTNHLVLAGGGLHLHYPRMLHHTHVPEH